MELPWKPDSLENALTLATLFEVTAVFLKGIFYSHGDSQAVPGTILVPGLRPPVKSATESLVQFLKPSPWLGYHCLELKLQQLKRQDLVALASV